MCLIGVAEGATGSGSRLGAGGGGALALTGAHGSTGVSPVVTSIRATRPIATRISVSIARRPAGKDRTETHTATAGLDQDQRGAGSSLQQLVSKWRSECAAQRQREGTIPAAARRNLRRLLS